MDRRLAAVTLPLACMIVAACASKAGNLAVGAGVGAGAAYEYQNKRELDQLKQDYEAGKINKQEYDQRRKEIENRSIVY